MTVNAMYSVGSLPDPTKEESVEEARKILRWLRNMEFADKDVEQWLDNSTPKVVTAKKEALHKLIRIMAIHIHYAKIRGLDLLSDPYLSNAADAIAAMAMSIAEHTFNLIPLHHRRLKQLEEMIDEMEERALMRQSQPLSQLLDTIEFGLERATGQEVSDLSAHFRLQAISQNLHKTAAQLESNQPLAEPTHEESLDLARDILRKMQSLSFGAQTVAEVVERMKPEDKAAFANAFSEMANLYRNIVSEASVQNPDLLKDQKIQEANDSISQFAHAVNLMAAKEMPSSIATAQHIAADVTRTPEKWGDLCDRTVERIMKSAEGGLEKAIDEMAEQQDQEQEQEMAQEAIEAALNLSDSKKRRKKRRGDSKSRSGKGGKKQRKQDMDIKADDYALKEGRFAVDAETARVGSDVPIAALNPKDLAVIRALGGSLRDIGSQLKDMTTSVSNVSSGDKIMPSPNEQSAAQRILDNDQPRPTNPRGTNGPGI
jgi:hypothetical protein